MNTAIDRLIAKLHADSAHNDPWRIISAYIAVDAAVDAQIVETKSRILVSALAWGADGQELASRAAAVTRALAEIGATLSERCEASRDEEQDDRLLQVILIALANHGSSTRWSAMLHANRPQPDYAAIHALYRRAERLGMSFARARIMRDGRPWILNAEAHYLRTLLMPIACHEALDPQQLEIVENLLWGWIEEYRLTRQVEGSEPRLWVDTLGRTGVSVRQFMPQGEDVRHLVVARMGAQIRSLTEYFHGGRLPGLGCAATFPIEAHTGLLDQLQVLWQQIQNGAPKRRFERTPRDGNSQVQALVGLPEILGHGDPHFKPAPKSMRILDESLGGAGLALERPVWDEIWHGDLVGLCDVFTTIPRVGVVVRKFVTETNEYALGIEWIACTCRKLTITATNSDRGAYSIPALYVAGDDDSGRSDTLVIDERRFKHDTEFEVPLEDRVFEVRLNRLLRRGRGWVAAGYEVAGVRKGELVS